VRKPASDLERFLAGDFAETQDGMPLAIFLVAVLLIALGAAL
jgi:hypothetical protein